jgi:hypothetical protein
LEGRDSLVHTFKLSVKVLGDHNISVTAGLANEYNATCGPDILVNLRYYDHRRVIIFDNKLSKFRDGVMKTIIVKPEGYPVEITQSMFMCLTGKAKYYLRVSRVETNLCLNAEEGESASMTWHLPVPENAVPDSARGELAVIGDVMGPSLEVKY